MSFIYNLILATTSLVILFFSIYFTIKLKGIQFNFKRILLSIVDNGDTKVTSYKILSLSVAAGIGVGSLAGTALAIYLGGPGSVFWMWVTTLLTAILTYSESILGSVYHSKDKDVYIGGPSYYIQKGLGHIKLSKIYSILIILGYIVGFLSIQSNTVSKIVSSSIHIDPYIIGIIISIVTSFVIFGGIKGIMNITIKLVPIMSVFFIIVSLYILFINYDKLLDVFFGIIKSAFNFQSINYGILSSFFIGLQRGIFATESGIGTSAISSAIAKDNPKKQGLIQIFGVYFTVFVIISLTSFIILLSDYRSLDFSSVNGIEITSYAYHHFLGNFGNLTIIISVILFALSTIISGYYYGESNLKILFKKDYSFILRILTLLILFISSIMTPKILWNIVDIFVGLLVIINIISVFKLKKDVFYEHKI